MVHDRDSPSGPLDSRGSGLDGEGREDKDMGCRKVSGSFEIPINRVPGGTTVLEETGHRLWGRRRELGSPDENLDFREEGVGVRGV